MADLPKGVDKTVFTQALDGVFGRFTTAQSFELYYLLTTLRLKELDRLVTAAEAFSFAAISFEELIQRDIDFERVDKEIVVYLESGHDSVRFFPPLLASLVPIEGGRPIERYQSVTNLVQGDSEKLFRTWDEDKFQLELNLTAKPTGYSIDSDGKSYNFYPYAATLNYNPEKTKLIAIDGQHRLVALKRLLDRDQSDKLGRVEVPICVFFPPSAIKGTNESESLRRDLRELFVTINSKAKQVSGHFLVLLDDRALSSYSVRSLADKWKGAESDPAPSLLHLLEWNTREKAQSFQRQREYTITTVSVIAEALEKYLFRRRVALTEVVLNLPERKEELNLPGCPTYGSISEEIFALEQVPILNEQIDAYITPALHALFTQPRPYSSIAARFKARFTELEQQIAAAIEGTKQFRDNVLCQFRRCRGTDPVPVQDAEKAFEKDLRPEPGDDIFFRNVFQQAWIRAWSELCRELVRQFDLTPQKIAEALVHGADELCFDSKLRIFEASPEHPYLQGQIYRNENIIVSETARLQCFHLILGTFSNDQSRKALTKILPKAVEELVKELATKSLRAYVAKMSEQIRESIRSNWRFDEAFDQQTKTYLANREYSQDDEEKTEFATKLAELAKERISTAATTLANVLSISTELFAADQLDTAVQLEAEE